jgi:competence protein ComEC
MPPPLLVLSLAFIAGLLLPEWYPLDWRAPAGIALAFFLLGLLERRLSSRFTWLAAWRTFIPLPVGIILAAVLAGSALAMASHPQIDEGHVAWYNERGEVRLIGVIDRPPMRYDRVQRFQVRVERITPLYAGRSERNYPAEGWVLVESPVAQKLSYGDRVRIAGKLSAPPDEEGFSYREHLARRRIYSILRLYTDVHVMRSGQGSLLLAGIYNLREQAYAALVRSVPQPEASLLAGILLGIETDMPHDLKRAFQDTGTSHIIAISGFNVAILATVFMGIFLRCTPRLLAPFLAILALGVYTVFVGAQASVVRAAIMGSVGLVGHAIGRRQAGANTLVFTAAVMCAFNPGVLGDAGFLLSFFATLGLILYADPLQTWFTAVAERVIPSELAQRISGPVGEYFLFTTAAQATTLPVILAIFGRLSISSAVANPLILPAQPPVMVLGGIAVIAGMIVPAAGDLLAHLVTPLLAYTIDVVEWLGRPAWGSTGVGEVSLWVCAAYYLVLFGLTIWRARLGALLGRLNLAGALDWGGRFLRSRTLWIGLGLVAVFAWRSALALPDGRLHLAVLPCGENAVLYVRAPGGQTVLVGGGEKTRDLASSLGRRLRPLYPHIDLLVLPNGDKTAPRGLADLTGRITFGQALLEKPDLRIHEPLSRELRRQGAVIHPPAAGQVFDLGSGAQLKVLAHTESGTAVLLVYGNLRVLAPGGVSLGELHRRHEALQPSLLVLSGRDLKETGETQWWQLEPLAVVATQSGEEENWLNLDEVGWVQVVSDGQQMWVEVEDGRELSR